MSLALSRPLATPDAALAAVVLGILLLYLEFNLPGTVLSGCLGTLSLMLGLFAFSRMPIQPASLASACAGFGLLLLAIVSRRALLAAALGWAALTAGLLHLVDPSRHAGAVHLPAALLAGLLFSASTVWLGRVALRARRNKQSPARASAHLAE